MAMVIKYEGVKNSLHDLQAAGFTQSNKVGNVQKVGNLTIPDDAPLGVLGGSVAALKGSRVVGAFATGNRPIGLFLNDAAGAAWENTPTVASGKAPFLMGNSEVEIDVYEYVDAATGATPLVYAVGDALYGSPNGLVTKENTGSAQIQLGVVTKVPTATSPTLGLILII